MRHLGRREAFCERPVEAGLDLINLPDDFCGLIGQKKMDAPPVFGIRKALQIALLNQSFHAL